jgi:hypothetical protein
MIINILDEEIAVSTQFAEDSWMYHSEQDRTEEEIKRRITIGKIGEHLFKRMMGDIVTDVKMKINKTKKGDGGIDFTTTDDKKISYDVKSKDIIIEEMNNLNYHRRDSFRVYISTSKLNAKADIYPVYLINLEHKVARYVGDSALKVFKDNLRKYKPDDKYYSVPLSTFSYLLKFLNIR